MKPIAGIACLCADTDGKIIGKPYKSRRTNLRDRYYIEGIGGEHWGCVLTGVARRYPYPEVEGFIPEGYVWLQMAKDYDDLSVNEALRIYHAHEPDALSQKRLTLTPGNILYASRMIRHDWMYAWASPVRFIRAAIIALLGPLALYVKRWI